MMPRPRLLAVLAAAAAYQAVMLPLYKVWSAGPDFVWIVLCYAAMYEKRLRSLFLAVIVGALTDAVSLDPWGVHAAGYGAAAGFLGLTQLGGWTQETTSRFVVLALAAVVFASMRTAIVWEIADPYRFRDLFWTAASAWYSVLAGVIVFALLDPLRGRLVTVRYRKLMGGRH